MVILNHFHMQYLYVSILNLSAQEIVFSFLQVSVLIPSPLPFRYSAFLPSFRPFYSSGILIQHQGLTAITSLHRNSPYS